MMKKVRGFAAMCVLVLAMGAMTACGGNNKETTGAPAETVAETDSTGAGETTEDTTSAAESDTTNAAESDTGVAESVEETAAE